VSTRASQLRKKKRPSTDSSESLIPGVGETSQAPTEFQAFCWLIYGQKGIGKTTLCSQLTDKSLVCMFEDRFNLSIRKVDLPSKTVEELENGEDDPWLTFKSVIAQSLERDDVDLIVVDTVDMAYQACLNHVCKEEGVRHPSDVNDYGSTWNLVKEEFRKTMESIRKSGKICLVFTSHCTQDRVELNTGKKATLYGPTCPGAPLQYLKQSCDYAIFFGKHGSQRALHVRWDEDIWTACGVQDTFLDPKGKPIAAIQAGSRTSSGKSLVSAFYNKPITDIIAYEEDIVPDLSSQEDDEEEEETPVKRPAKKKFKKS